MNFIWDKLTEWLGEVLVGGIMDALTGLFDNVNEQITGIAGNVGATPQTWNGSIFAMVRGLSDNVVVPVAGVILALVATLELVQMLVDRSWTGNIRELRNVVERLLILSGSRITAADVKAYV